MFRNRLEELSREKAPATTWCVPVVAGSLARSLACTVCYPIDLARTRMQVWACTLSLCSLVTLDDCYAFQRDLSFRESLIIFFLLFSLSRHSKKQKAL